MASTSKHVVNPSLDAALPLHVVHLQLRLKLGPMLSECIVVLFTSWLMLVQVHSGQALTRGWSLSVIQ